MSNIYKLTRSGQTVFTTNDIGQILSIDNKKYLRLLTYRLVKSQMLNRIKNGVLVLPNYDVFELASKMKEKSYISFETVLQKEWIIFQNYSKTVKLASDNTITKTTKDYIFEYHKLSSEILYNPLWIIIWFYNLNKVS